MRKTNSERFWTKVARGDLSDCWEWQGCRNRDGYGVFWNGEWRDEEHTRQILMLAHRWVYAEEVGEIPAGHYVLHSCDNTSCVNPAHLWTGTQKDNVRDCIAKGRWGQWGTFHKLSVELHEEINRLYLAGEGSQDVLAKRFGVSQATISHIVRRRRR